MTARKHSPTSKAEDLEDFCLLEISIECEKCKRVDGTQHIDEYYFAKDMQKKGWRVINEQCLCPTCVKKSKH